jgi:hypothetical protein
MPDRRCALTLLAVVHLAVVLGGACDWLPGSDRGPLAHLVRWYATLTGAESGYGFFAPDVGAPHRAIFILRDEKGSTWSDTFDQAKSSEARLRLTGIVESVFMNGVIYDKPQLRSPLVESWAATMFRRHPNAVSLTVVVESYDIPTMTEHRSGSRPQWQAVYQAEVARHRRAPDQWSES